MRASIKEMRKEARIMNVQNTEDEGEFIDLTDQQARELLSYCNLVREGCSNG